MNNIRNTLLSTSVLIFGIGLMPSLPPANAFTMDTSLSCDVAASALNPDYDAFQGAYVLDNGENDVANGDADNIVSQLLNVDDIFGDKLYLTLLFISLISLSLPKEVSEPLTILGTMFTGGFGNVMKRKNKTTDQSNHLSNKKGQTYIENEN